MKRLILTGSFILLLITSCDSPVNTGAIQQKSNLSQQGSVAAVPRIPYSVHPVTPDTARKAIWQQFKTQNGKGWRIRWNQHTGLPASLFLGLSKKKYGGSAEQAARAFLADHQSLFGFASLDQLHYIKTQTFRGVRHITFNQTVKGVPVYEAEYKVHLRADGQVDMVMVRITRI